MLFYCKKVKTLIIYLAFINVVTFLAYGLDKAKSKRKQWRTPEAVLLGLAIIGGSAGAWLAMRIFHHKTQHSKFKIGIPIIFYIQLTIIFLFWELTTKNKYCQIYFFHIAM